MQPFKSRHHWAIIGLAILGGAYGLIATLSLGTTSVSLWEIAVPVASGAALSACGGSALSRLFETWRLLKDDAQPPINDALIAGPFFQLEFPVNEQRLNTHRPSAV